MRAEPDESATAEGWHEAAAERLVARVAQKSRFALEALAQLYVASMAPDLVCVVFSESDTVAHHFWRDHDPTSPRHDPSASTVRRFAIAAVYEALDAACGELRAALGSDAACFVRLGSRGRRGRATRRPPEPAPRRGRPAGVPPRHEPRPARACGARHRAAPPPAAST